MSALLDTIATRINGGNRVYGYKWEGRRKVSVGSYEVTSDPDLVPDELWAWYESIEPEYIEVRNGSEYITSCTLPKCSKGSKANKAKMKQLLVHSISGGKIDQGTLLGLIVELLDDD